MMQADTSDQDGKQDVVGQEAGKPAEKAWVVLSDAEEHIAVSAAFDHTAVSFHPLQPVAGGIFDLGWIQVEHLGRFLLQKRFTTLRLVFDGYLIASGRVDVMRQVWASVLPLQAKLEPMPTSSCLERLTIWVRSMETAEYKSLVAEWEVVGEKDDQPAAAVESILHDIKADNLRLPKYPVPLEYVGDVHRNLLCYACGCPAVDPHRSEIFYREHIFCKPCLIAEASGYQIDFDEFVRPDPRAVQLLDALKVRCPFCGAVERRCLIEAHMDSCQLVNFVCPFATVGCPFKAPDSERLLQHWLGCNYVHVVHDSQGSFRGCTRDVIQLIVGYLPVDDVWSLSLANKWFREAVKFAYRMKTCPRCHFIHSDAHPYHPGTWASASYHDVIYVKENARKQRFRESASSAGSKALKGVAIGAAGFGAGVLGLIVGAPLLALGFLGGSGSLMAYGIMIPITAAEKVGKAVASGVQDRVKPKFSAWTCCGREGSFAEPCARCDPDDDDE